MTNGERKALVRGVSAGVVMGVALGLMIALLIAIRPDLFAGLMH